jgi:CheY-like chemotaxis protein
MEKSRRLLVLDEHHETEEVLRAVLEPAGTSVTRVRSWQQLQNSEPDQAGTVLVLHSNETLDAHPEANSYSEVPRVIIGRTETESSREAGSCKSSGTPAREHQLEDLFEFKDLLQAIDSLWKSAS